MNIVGEGGILLIGNPKDAFSQTHTEKLSIQEVCPQLSEGIEAAGKRTFAAVAVVMAGNTVKLKAGLIALRKNTDARILLLARMFEEPMARTLVGTNGSGPADDY